MPQLFDPLTIRDVTFKNRIGVSPMCQYSCEDGVATNWHLVHLGSRAVGGAGMVMVEASAVSPEGRISPGDMGIWGDKHVEAFKPITAFIAEHGAIPAIQLAHAGRKASCSVPWEDDKFLSQEAGGWWPLMAPSAIPFNSENPAPPALSVDEIHRLVDSFAQAAKRAKTAGFEMVEIHAAHGYLAHGFLSPLSNHREDEYGGSLENRMRFVLEIIQAVRSEWPSSQPLFMRISSTDWVESGGWDMEQSIILAGKAKALGVDLIDCSSGGNVNVQIPVGPGYQVPFADAIKHQAGVLTAAVGMITEPQQASDIITNQQADMVLLARELLRDPYWPLHAATALNVDIDWPKQYQRAKPRLAAAAK